MLRIRIAALAIVAIAALSAFGATSSASAVQLCKTINCSTTVMTGSFVEASLKAGTVARFIGDGTVSTECSTSSFSDEYVAAGTPAKAIFRSFKFASCVGSTCKVTASVLPWESTITGGGNGTISAISKTGSLFITLSCGELECEYHQEQINMTFKGGTAPTAEMNTVVMPLVVKVPAQAKACGSQVKWTGTYSITSPTPLFIV